MCGESYTINIICLVPITKVEGGSAMAPTVARLVAGGVAVVGHVGLTPQASGVLGGFRPQGRTAADAHAVVADAQALETAGAFAVVIECVPPAVAAAITAAVSIPTIGIGAGPGCDGQVRCTRGSYSKASVASKMLSDNNFRLPNEKGPSFS